MTEYSEYIKKLESFLVFLKGKHPEVIKEFKELKNESREDNREVRKEKKKAEE